MSDIDYLKSWLGLESFMSGKPYDEKRFFQYVYKVHLDNQELDEKNIYQAFIDAYEDIYGKEADVYTRTYLKIKASFVCHSNIYVDFLKNQNFI